MEEAVSSASEAAADSQTSHVPHRRPRVREVSSRFLTPSAPRSFSSSSLSPVTRSKPRSSSVERQYYPGASLGADENRNDSNRVSPQRIHRAVTKLTFAAGDHSDTPHPPNHRLIAEKTPNLRTPGIPISSRYLKERSRRIPNSASSSLDLQTPIRDTSSIFHSLKPHDSESLKGISRGLPPPPTKTKLTSASLNLDIKQRKSQAQLEDAHSLKLHHNRLLQWRFINAKAESSSQAQQAEAEKQLLTQITKNSELLESVSKQRMEVARLRSYHTLKRIVEAQAPLLDDWSSIEEEHQSNLSEAIQSLLNCSVRLPLGEKCSADVAEMRQCLNSATNLMESIFSKVTKLFCTAQQGEVLMSELANVVNDEKAMIDQSGELLSVLSMSSVAEFSVRSHLIQILDKWGGRTDV